MILLLFFIIDLHFLIPAVIAIPTGTQTNEANAEIETQLLIVEAKISKCST